MEQYFQVGVISSTHGVHGEVKVYPTTDDPRRFLDLEQVLMENGRDFLSLDIEKVRFFKQMVIIKFKGFDNINDIQMYRNRKLFVPRAEAVPLEEDEYYIADLIGMKVYTRDGEEFGEVKDVLTGLANDVYVIRSLNHGEVLIPGIYDCVTAINVEESRMEIRLMDGLID